MKKKITRIWSIGLVVVLAASLLLSAAPVSAGTLGFGSETLPTTTNNLLATAGTNILDVAVGPDGTTIYAAAGTVGALGALYKSTDGGVTWSRPTVKVAVVSVDLVAVAPDDGDVVVVVDTTALEVHVSTNGGSTWSDLGTVTDVAAMAAPIFCLDVSPLDGSTRYIAVGGNTAANAPSLLYFNLGASAPVWTDAVQNAAWTGEPVAPIDNIRALAFSPNFASDLIVTAVSEQLTAGAAAAGAFFHMASFNQKKWDTTAGFTTYPITLEGGIVSTGVWTVNTADIALDPSYLGGDDSSRIAFVGASITDAGLATPEIGGIYRLKDTSLKQIYDSNTGIASVDWDGTNLVAGPSGSNVVKRSADALATSPTISSATNLKRPGGATLTVVRFAGSNVVGATSGASSAFAISEDDGKTFNDVSLIDATLTTLDDIWITPDGTVIYMLTNDGAEWSLWRKASSWQRVWYTVTAPTGPLAYTVRGAPNDNDVVYIADLAGTNMWYSNNGGTTKWFTRASRYPIQDLAVESQDVAYVAADTTNNVSKTTNAGFTWGTSKGTSLAGGTEVHSITSIGEDKLIVGGNQGHVSYSTDGNSSWTKISKALNVNGAGGLTQVVASGLSDGDFIYASSALAASKVERWEIGTSTSWKDMEINGTGPLPAGIGVYGMALVDGTLYVSTATTPVAVPSVIYRNIGPTNANPATGHWSTLTDAASQFTIGPSALRTSTGSTKLWAIDVAGNLLRSYVDTIATTAPALSGPGDGADVQMNIVAGGHFAVMFSWNRPSTATVYQLRVATDPDFNEVFWAPANTAASSSSVLALPAVGIGFNPGSTYYWRVRVVAADPIGFSPWSEVRSFTVAELPEAQVPVIIEQPPAPVIEVPAAPEIILQPPEIVLPAPTPAPEIVIPAAPAPAPAVPSWAIYAIIIIGAVLVIALIILIMRTRRPV